MDVDELRADNQQLRERVSELEQFSRRSNIEIQGVPQDNQENINEVVVSVAKAVGSSLATSDIDKAHRVASFGGRKGCPKNIIVSLRSHTASGEFLTAYKKAAATFKRANPGPFKGLSFENLASNLFVNEHLTPGNKLLLKQAKAWCRQCDYKYCWIQYGVVKVRKQDNSNVFFLNLKLIY